MKTTTFRFYWLFLLLAILLLLGGGGLLVFLGSGFPPQSWLDLIQLAPVISHRWEVNGNALLAPISLVVLQAFFMLLSWGALVYLVIRACIFAFSQRYQNQLRDAENALDKLGNPPQSIWEPTRSPLSDAGPASQVSQPFHLQSTQSIEPPTVLPSAQNPPPVSWNEPSREQEANIHTQNSKPGISKPSRNTAKFDDWPAASSSPTRKTIKFDVDYEDEPSPIGIVESQPWNLASLPVDFQDMLNDTYAELVYRPDSSITYRLGVRSHVGKNKQKRVNGDRLFAQQWEPGYRTPAETSALVIVVDGEKFGQAVSRQIVEELSDAMVPLILSELDEEALTAKLFTSLQALLRAVQVHYDLGEEVPGIFVSLMLNTRAYILELGTCRGYLYRGSHELGRIQDFSPEHLHGDAQLHIWALTLEDNDVLIGCSDGLWRYLPEPEMAAILARHRQEPAEAAFELVDKGLERSGEDYLTAVLVAVMEANS